MIVLDHTVRLTQEFLENSGLKLFKHPFYYPDLPPCDFGLFQCSQRNALFEPILDATPTIPPYYRSTFGGRVVERVCDAQERPHIGNMTGSPFRQTIIKTLNCLYY